MFNILLLDLDFRVDRKLMKNEIKTNQEFYRIGDVLLDEGVDVDNVQDVLEDVLLLLSPYNLLKSAQWLLQWLVSTFKVNY